MSVSAGRRPSVIRPLLAALLCALAALVFTGATAQAAPPLPSVQSTVKLDNDDQYYIQSALDPETGLLYVSDPANASIAVVYTAKATRASTGGKYVITPRGGGEPTDPKPDTVVHRIHVPDDARVYGLGIDTKTHRIYGSATEDDKLVLIKGNDATATATKGEVDKVVALGGHTRDVEVDSDTGLVYVTQAEGASVAVVDGKSGKIRRTLDAGDDRHPEISWAGDVVLNTDAQVAYIPTLNTDWQTDTQPGSVSVVDLNTGALKQVVQTGGELATGAALDRKHNKLLVTNQGKDGKNASVATLRVNPATGRLRLQRTVPAAGPLAVAVDEEKGLAYATDFQSMEGDKVLVLSTITGAKRQELQVGKGPVHVVVDGDTHKAYVTNQSAGTVSIVEPGSRWWSPATVTATTNLSPRQTPYQVYQSAYNPNTGLLYVADPGANRIDIVYTAQATRSSTGGRYLKRNYETGAVTDPEPNSFVGWINAGEDAPYGVAVNPVTNTIYATAARTDKVTAYDGATDKIKKLGRYNEATAEIKGGHIREVRVDPKRDLAYVTSVTTNELTVLDGTTLAKQDAIKVADPDHPALKSAVGMELNGDDNVAYVASLEGGEGKNGAVSVIDLETKQVVQVIDGGAESTSSLAYDSKTRQLFVTSQGPRAGGNGGVATYKVGAGGKLTKAAYTETAPGALGATVDSDRGLVYSTDFGRGAGSKTVSVLSAVDGSLLGRVTVGNRPLFTSVDAKTGAAYVTNQADATVSVLGLGAAE